MWNKVLYEPQDTHKMALTFVSLAHCRYQLAAEMKSAHAESDAINYD